MSTFICSKCGCIDNTACGGNYWDVQLGSNSFKDDFANKNLLCSECTPSEFEDGSRNEGGGKWHNRFPKKHWSDCGTKEKLIAICKHGNGSFINAVEYFDKCEKAKEKEV